MDILKQKMKNAFIVGQKNMVVPLAMNVNMMIKKISYAKIVLEMRMILTIQLLLFHPQDNIIIANMIYLMHVLNVYL